MPRIREQYVDTGKVRFSYKHFAILGPESTRTAEASECANEQGQFWPFHDLTFADQITTRSSLSADRLTELAGQLGLDTTAFRTCLDSGRYTSQITQESLSVQSLGVRGTPAFLVNGVFISGAQPFDVFQQVIDEQLAQLPPAEAPVEAAAAPTATPVPPAPPPEPQTSAQAAADIPGVELFPEQDRNHQDGKIEYDHAASPGGKHSDAWQNCGIYTAALAQEPVVHSLEHGAVWVAYQPDLPADQVALLQAAVRAELQAGTEPLVLLSPQPGLDAAVVASAWRAQLKLDDPADARLAQFLQVYQNGPYTPEPGAPCSGGIGEPVE